VVPAILQTILSALLKRERKVASVAMAACRVSRDPSHKQEGGSGQQGGTGNFANDREKASEAGRKGGQN
jgi:hypothetical protein